MDSKNRSTTHVTSLDYRFECAVARGACKGAPGSRFASAAQRLALAAVLSWLGSCGADTLGSVEGGLTVTLTNAPPEAPIARVDAASGAELRHVKGEFRAGQAELKLVGLHPGLWNVQGAAEDGAGVTLRAAVVNDVRIKPGEYTTLTIDLSAALACDPNDPAFWPLCTTCTPEGGLVAVSDDNRCATIDCSAYQRWTLTGDNSASGTSTCTHEVADNVSSGRCDASGCRQADATVCSDYSVAGSMTAGLCLRILDCEAGQPRLEQYPAGTPCGGTRTCDAAGNCVDPTKPPIGCADGAREGFLDYNAYPNIAGCSGSWTVPGVTRADLAPTCNRQGGDDSPNRDGGNCSAADLCDVGWHVCRGKDEVAAKSPTGCDGAVPPGTPGETLLFAVAQHSTQNSVCDDTGNSNDVFGCGNLGGGISSGNNCGVLNRVLASMNAGSCGWNQAQPPLGPYVCVGGTDSHLKEGALVTKNGCPNASCEMGGVRFGSSDKGGVLCCRD
jgi:hypothetical protein